MALNIKNPATARLAHRLAEVTGETITEAVTVALRERLTAVERRQRRAAVRDAVAEIQAFVRAQPDLDPRPAEEILGYDDAGLPG